MRQTLQPLKNIMIEYMEKNKKILLYFDPLVDKEPVDVKVIQYNEKKKSLEITRNLAGTAGFWVNENSNKFIKIE